MKYLPCCVALVLGCGTVAIGIIVTGNPKCLWALLGVAIITEHMYPNS